MTRALGWLLLCWTPWTAVLAADPLPPGIIAVEDRTAAPFELADMDGQRYTLTPAAERWRFVHFWASWCGPCRREMPAIERVTKKIDDSKWDVVLINTAEDEDTIFTFLAGTAPELSTLLDRDGQVTEAWRPRGLPATYLVDPGGRVRYQALGGREWDEGPYLNFLQSLPRSDARN